MDAATFVAKWEKNTLNERAASQSHFIDLCLLLGVPTPTDYDQSGERYTFEKLTDKDSGKRGFADVWYERHFAWEYKKPGSDLEKALAQLRLYSGALGNPPLLVVSDMKIIRIVTQFNGYVTKTYTFKLNDFLERKKLLSFKSLWTDPDQFRPDKTREAVTKDVAEQFTRVASMLRTRNIESHKVSQFLIRVLFCLFAENIGLLPKKHFSTMLEECFDNPINANERILQIFAVMSKGGMDGNVRIPYFNGDLFTNSAEEVVMLSTDEWKGLYQTRNYDWANIEPTIFGTLFERGLDPAKQARYGVHFTREADIEKIIEPVVMQPLRAQWIEAKNTISELIEVESSKEKIKMILDNMRAIISGTTILDPACGSGNFLYVTLKKLHDLEYEVFAAYDQYELELPSVPLVGPQQLKGADINDYAAQLARAVIWIGHLQWTLSHDFSISEPILQKLDNIICQDSLLNHFDTPHPIQTAWQTATCIVSNPPFLGDKLMRSDKGQSGGLGDKYVDTLRKTYGNLVPGGADLVCYFVAHAWQEIKNKNVKRVGLITTNSIAGGSNRHVLDIIKREGGNIFFAWSDLPWALNGAAVRISMIGFDIDTEDGHILNGQIVNTINSDLTSGIDLTPAKKLVENAGIAFIGTQKSGDFDIPSTIAKTLLNSMGNPNNKSNNNVVKRWINASDIVATPRNNWIIDFNDMPLEEAAQYEAPFEYIKKHVMPKRLGNRDKSSIENWWLHARPRPEMRSALFGMARYIATPRHAKYRIFIWVDASIVPDSAVVVFARDDDYTFGILHSHPHQIWSLRKSTRIGKGNDPRYTPTTAFETFPFPYADEQQQAKISEVAQHLVQQRNAWLNPPDATDVELKHRTLTALYNAQPQWLANAHAALDRAVYAAYGWPIDIGDNAILEALLTENLARAGVGKVNSNLENEAIEAEDDDVEMEVEE